VVRISNGFWTVVVVVDLLWGLVCNTSSSRHLASASSAISLCIAQQGQSVPQDAIPLRALTRSATGLWDCSNSARSCASRSIGNADKALLSVTGILGFGVARFLGNGVVRDLNP
jgi:hypothetical protein